MNEIGARERDFYSRRPIPASSDFVSRIEKEEEELEKLKYRVSILDVVRRHVNIKVRKDKRGYHYAVHYGICPFHVEKTPSFGISLQRGIFHCWGCGAGGDAFDFIKKIRGVDFHGAVKILKKMYGMTVSKKYGKVYKKKYFNIESRFNERGERTEELVFLEDEVSQKVRDVIYQEREEKYSLVHGKTLDEVLNSVPQKISRLGTHHY